MNRTVLACTLFIALLRVPSGAEASAPPFIPIQGFLEDAGGNPVSGDVSVGFTIYDAEVEGATLWYETQNILVEQGLFAVYLGEVESLDLGMFLENTHLWLGVQIESDPEMGRVYLGSTPYTAYAEYCGNIPDHSHPFSDVTGTLPATALPEEAAAGPQSCPGSDKAVGIDSSGALICATDEDTTYLAGSGLALSGTTFSVDYSLVQARVTDTCPAGSSIRSVHADGTVGCEGDDDTLGELGCSVGQVAAWNGSAWTCGQPGSRCAYVDTYGDDTCYRADGTFASSRGFSWCMAVSAYPRASNHQGVFIDSSCSATGYGTADATHWWCVNYSLTHSGTCYGNDYYIGNSVYLICCN